ASRDTRAAVEEFLRRDPSLASLAEDGVARPSAGAELERRTVAETRAVIRRRSWLLAVAILFTTLPFSFVFRGSQVTFFMLRDQPYSALLLLGAAVMWIQYARRARSWRTAGL